MEVQFVDALILGAGMAVGQMAVELIRAIVRAANRENGI